MFKKLATKIRSLMDSYKKRAKIRADLRAASQHRDNVLLETIHDLRLEIQNLIDEIETERKLRKTAEDKATDLEEKDKVRERKYQIIEREHEEMKKKNEHRDFIVIQVMLNSNLSARDKKRFQNMLT